MTDESVLNVIEGLEIRGEVNTSQDNILHHIRHAIRLGYTQVRPESVKTDRVALVGGGPSLADTHDELRDLVWAGAKIVALNGAYDWCLSHNLKPSAQIVLDARVSTKDFLTRAVPGCLYAVASQCHPEAWEAVKGREKVVIYHAVNPDHPETAILDAYYGKGRWYGVVGGTTVATRALTLLRAIGYLRFDLFGIDCCWLHGQHHAFPQAQNANDKRLRVTVTPSRGDEKPRDFECAPWHIKQFEDILQIIRLNGEHFVLNVHGDGLLAHGLRAGARVEAKGAAG